MALSPGARLGPYEIVAPLGAGGMGEVYKATDTRLNRTVAIKVMPPHFADEEMLLESELSKVPFQWSPDGQYLLYWVRDPKTADDIWVWPVADKKPRPLLATDARERHAQISHDGKWTAYSSTLAGGQHIFVQPFPSGTGRWQVSPDSENGGAWPRWSQKTSELLYRAPTTSNNYSLAPMNSAAWQAKGVVFTHASPKPLVRINALAYPHSSGPYHTFAVSPDGQRFLIFQRVLTGDTTTTATTSDADPIAGITILMHWTQGLKK